ncbi:hypothetical protein G5B38_00280 [Pseudohalocynthiibacter aestuariivivens]|nr:Hint domain-containing protein [Pseudohalocynthiibacter aestuariivivens]QIE44086.1 hypothetical protein G5B38_00280 [Pseudohalocynthiibacter aestuariivivens]
MATLDHDIWLTAGNGTAEDGDITLSEGGNSTIVTADFTENAWDASQSGYNISQFGAFGVTSPIRASFDFSNPVENLTFDLEHVNSSGTTYDDMFTIYAYDHAGNLLDAADVIAGLSGLVDDTVIVNADGSISIEGDGGTANNIGVSLPGRVSQLDLVFEDGPDGSQSGGAGIGDFSFTIPTPLDYIIEGGSGDDTIDASYTGDPEGDRIDNSDHSDGSNDDSVLAGAGNDSVISGAGDDTVFGDDGDDTLIGGEGNDRLDGDSGSDSISGGDGDDTIIGDDGDDTLLGDDGDDEIYVSSGKNTLDGGAGRDQLYGGSGNDSLSGGTGADALSGGGGDDTLNVATGDKASGGDGDDVFVLTDLGEGAGDSISITGGEGDETDGDTLLLTPDVRHDDITFTNPDGDAGGLSGSFNWNGTKVSFSEIEKIICFTAGTQIMTVHGDRPIETLRIGDRVVTRDSGLRAIRWIGKRTVVGRGAMAPISISPAVLDGGRAPLLVSPQHRMLFTGYRAEMLFGRSEVLVAAKHLVNGGDIHEAPCDTVTYIHLMLDAHEIIYAEGTATESFYAGSSGLGAITEESREEMFALFPELRWNTGAHGRTARVCLKPHEARLLQ